KKVVSRRLFFFYILDPSIVCDKKAVDNLDSPLHLRPDPVRSDAAFHLTGIPEVTQASASGADRDTDAAPEATAGAAAHSSRTSRSRLGSCGDHVRGRRGGLLLGSRVAHFFVAPGIGFAGHDVMGMRDW